MTTNEQWFDDDNVGLSWERLETGAMLESPRFGKAYHDDSNDDDDDDDDESGVTSNGDDDDRGVVIP